MRMIFTALALIATIALGGCQTTGSSSTQGKKKPAAKPAPHMIILGI